MPDFKNNRFAKKSFGPKRHDGPREMYPAECSNCHKMTQVPFRPNGKKPVFCSDCFKGEERGGARESRPYTRPSFAPQAAPDHRIDEVKRQVIMLDSKIDRLTKLVEGLQRKPAVAAAVEAAVTKAPAKKKATKKVAKKKA